MLAIRLQLDLESCHLVSGPERAILCLTDLNAIQMILPIKVRYQMCCSPPTLLIALAKKISTDTGTPFFMNPKSSEIVRLVIAALNFQLMKPFTRE